MSNWRDRIAENLAEREAVQAATQAAALRTRRQRPPMRSDIMEPGVLERTASDLLIPQTPQDIALALALGPAGRVVPRAVRAGAIALGIGTTADEAKAGPAKLVQSAIKAAPDVVRGKRALLPMDEASRMARAAEQGYTLPTYHGTAKPGFSEFEARQPALGPAGVYSATDTSHANAFARDYIEGTGGVYPLLVRGPIAPKAYRDKLSNAGLERDEIVRKLKDEGYRGYYEDKQGSGLVTFDPKDVRSRFAAFDPVNKGSGFLLGGLAGAAALPAMSNEAEAGPVKLLQKGIAAAPDAIRGTRAASAIEAAPDVVRGIRAYHGSPHDFDKFDLSKIGTGEGAQVYGHGLYFAENPEVANSYRITTTGKLFDVDRSPLGPLKKWQRDELDDIVTGLQRSGDLKQTIADRVASRTAQLDWRSRLADEMADYAQSPLYGRPEVLENMRRLRERDLKLEAQQAARAAGWVEQVAPRLEAKRAGHGYEVDIRARPEQFLDWDKPVAQQPLAFKPFAEEAAYQLGREPPSVGEMIPVLGRRRAGSWGGEGFARGHAALSEELKQAGVPGIKYLDQGSRAVRPDTTGMIQKYGSRDAALDVAQQRLKAASMGDLRHWQGIVDDLGTPQTSNYVVFDPSIVDIARKYAVPGMLAPMGGGAAVAPQMMPDSMTETFPQDRYAQ